MTQPMHPTRTILSPRSDPAQTQTSSQHGSANSSFFTFLIALLILVFASGALVFRALLLRRRFRGRIQAAIDAGILPRPPGADQKKPELHEICVRAASNIQDWHTLMPVCVTSVIEAEHDSKPAASTGRPTVYRPSAAGRLMELMGHRPVVTAVTQQPAADTSPDTVSEPSAVQVTVLIAMPAEHTSIPPLEPDASPISSKGKRRDSSISEDTLPDVMFGISTVPWSPQIHDSIS